MAATCRGQVSCRVVRIRDARIARLRSWCQGLPRARDYHPPSLTFMKRALYACNEVAINWNAPFVFSLAALIPE
jgi:hypothetical protein